jgi:hypothetical protein
MAAMGAGYVVSFVEIHANSDRRGLLAGVKMDKAGDFSRRKLEMDPFLEFSDHAHVAVGVQKLFAWQLHFELTSTQAARFTGIPNHTGKRQISFSRPAGLRPALLELMEERLCQVAGFLCLYPSSRPPSIRGLMKAS